MSTPRQHDREPQSAPRVYTIPPTAPFLDTLVEAVLAGELSGSRSPSSAELPRWTILLPTRRACRALRERFLAAMEPEPGALLLPRIMPLGDIDEDEIETSLAELAPQDALTLAPAIGATERRLVLAELILKWFAARAGSFAEQAPLETEVGKGTITPARAITLATSLARLLDAAETEQIELTNLQDLVPEAFAAHWQDTIAFLQIITEHWPNYLAQAGLMSPAARRNFLLAAEARRLAAQPPSHPVIAAGSTGSIPATAALLATIARLENGTVVLPGLDLSMSDADWTAIGDHAEHPQFGLKDLLQRMGVQRDQVRVLGAVRTDAAERARQRLISEAMRPSTTTDAWQALAGHARDIDWSLAASGLTLIEAPTAEDEAEVVALLLRHAVEQPGHTAALVTPDRALARRVAARLEKWDLGIDDSAGRPLGKTPAGIFAELVCEAAASNFAPVPLMALLKHPLTRLGRTPAAIRSSARVLELAVFRRPVLALGLSAARQALQRAHKNDRNHPAVARLKAADWQAAHALIDDLDRAFAPVAALAAAEAPLSALAEAHVRAFESLSRDEKGDALAWRGDDGEALALVLTDLLATPRPDLRIAASHFPDVFRALLEGSVVRPRGDAHPRLFIWGPLEARLQQPDTIVLGALNDGTWPKHEETDPWLNRPMRRDLGLSPPERRTGLAAHDVAQLLGGRRVILTRAQKVDGVPTVASRWLLRLRAVLSAVGKEDLLRPREPWLTWARRRDDVRPEPRMARPAPRPPVKARPRQLSVTQIEEWIANPYAIFARHILNLQPLDPLAVEIGPNVRGSLLHEALNQFTAQYGDNLPKDIAAALMQSASRLFEEYGAHPRVRAFWEPQFARFARWFADTEPSRRGPGTRVHAEVRGRLDLPGCDFRLTARADRIDCTSDGALIIYDYKTGEPPKRKQVSSLIAPQLPLEAAIAIAGGFDGIAGGRVAHLCYIRILGRGAAGEEIKVGNDEAASLAQEALERLCALVREFDRPETPYKALRRHLFRDRFRFDSYEHLARVAEWSTGEGEAAS